MFLSEPQRESFSPLAIKVEGQHVRGSPFSVAVKQPVEKLGTPIDKSLGGVKGPWGVAISQRGEVVVAEGGRHCISVFSPCADGVDGGLVADLVLALACKAGVICP